MEDGEIIEILHLNLTKRIERWRSEAEALLEALACPKQNLTKRIESRGEEG